MKNLNNYEIEYIIKENKEIEDIEKNTNSLYNFKEFVELNKDLIDVENFVKLLGNKLNKYINYNNKVKEPWNNKKIIFSIVSNKKELEKENIEEVLPINFSLEKKIKKNDKIIIIKLQNKYNFIDYTNNWKSIEYSNIAYLVNKENLLEITEFLKEISESYKRYYLFNKGLNQMVKEYPQWNFENITIQTILLLKLKFITIEYFNDWKVFIWLNN